MSNMVIVFKMKRKYHWVGGGRCGDDAGGGGGADVKSEQKIVGCSFIMVSNALAIAVRTYAIVVVAPWVDHFFVVLLIQRCRWQVAASCYHPIITGFIVVKRNDAIVRICCCCLDDDCWFMLLCFIHFHFYDPVLCTQWKTFAQPTCNGDLANTITLTKLLSFQRGHRL